MFSYSYDEMTLGVDDGLETGVQRLEDRHR